ncbi:MAG: aspartate aminotransferase family protein [Oscillatoriaceae cyanobacterium]
MLEIKPKTPIPEAGKNFDTWFLANTAASWEAYQQAISLTAAVLGECNTRQSQPYSGASPLELAASLAAIEVCPPGAKLLADILNKVGETVVRHSVAVSHPRCIAHLHCPPLIPALAAEMLIAATNQSLDSWDQSPAATVLEMQVIQWLCGEFGYDAGADGVFTSGGTQSNFMGMLLGRDAYVKSRFNWSVQQQGLPPEAHQFRILCSEVGHFTIRQACAHLGLGEQAVVKVKTDKNYRLSTSALVVELEKLHEQNLLPIAIAATAGTTDFGSIDPLAELGEIAQKWGLWLHIDAAFGGALVMSDRHRHQLAGIAHADSITVDFHKLFYQPISCGAFLLKDKTNLDLIKLHADYLNPETNEAQGIPDLVTKSVQTTRRFDALKMWISLQALGREGFSQIIDTTIELAAATAQLIAADALLELAHEPAINAVVFRYLPSKVAARDSINSQIRAQLLQQGAAVIAQTRINGETYLKFTLLNPRTTLTDITDILTTIKQLGRELEGQLIA